MIPDDPNALLTRKAAAAVLNAAGYPVAEKTLATKATRGGGPPFAKFGPRALYRWSDALRWAQSRLGPPIGSTSEADLQPTEMHACRGRSPSAITLDRSPSGPKQASTS